MMSRFLRLLKWLPITCPQLLILLAFLLPAATQAADWQYMGTGVVEGGEQPMFFSLTSVTRVANNHVKVWVKAISAKAIQQYNEKHDSDKKYVNDLAGKLAVGHVPRFFGLPTIRKSYLDTQKLQDAIMEVTQNEYIANKTDVKEAAKMHYEIDCQGKQLGVLSHTSFKVDGSVSKTTRDDKPEYDHIPPNSPGEWLSMMVCK